MMLGVACLAVCLLGHISRTLAGQAGQSGAGPRRFIRARLASMAGAGGGEEKAGRGKGGGGRNRTGSSPGISQRRRQGQVYMGGNAGLPGGTRTPDLLLRRQLLYPVELRAVRLTKQRPNMWALFRMVGAAGFELATLCSQSRCATRLRYSPTWSIMVGPEGLEPPT